MPRLKNANLILVSIRLLRDDIIAAKQLAKQKAIPYQHVIRGWVQTQAQRFRKDKDKP